MIKIPEDLFELIKAIGSGEYKNDLSGNIECVVKCLQSQPSLCMELAGMKWRKYPEEKPEKEEHYLVYPQPAHCEAALYQIYNKDKIPKWILCDSEGYEYEVYVTHWMPLPPLPTQEKE